MLPVLRGLIEGVLKSSTMNNVISKLSSTLPMVRKLGIAYIALSAGMFIAGFVSTLVIQLGQVQ